MKRDAKLMQLSRGRLWLRSILVAVLMAAISPSTLGAEATTPVVTGISTGSDILSMSPGEADATLAGIANAGAEWFRLDVPWFAVQPSAGAWDWRVTDRLVANAIRRNLKVLAILSYAPRWALTATGQPDPTRFAKFAGAAVARYARSGVDTWEIWNEENMNWAWPIVSPADYGKLLKAAFKAIHARQPGATVLLGGLGRAPDAYTLSQSPHTFLSDLLKRGYGAYFDALSFHPYTYPDWPDEPERDGQPAYEHGMADMARVRNLLVRYGRSSVKVWATEFGVPTSNDEDAVTQQVQADMIARAYEKFSTYGWAGPFFVFNWKDSSSQGFGLHTTTGARKLAHAAFTSISGG